MYPLQIVHQADPEIADAIQREIDRQESHLELIASENFASFPVMSAMGTPLTNKYAEGYPGHRYYGGCQEVDVVERIAMERCRKIFGCTYANVQPHSGTQANMAVELALCKPGDTILGMNLAHGGHLSHGSPVNFSGLIYKIVSYGVGEDGFIDYEEVRRLALEHKPRLIIAGASAYPRTIDFKRFREIADECGALLMADIAHIAGLVAAGLHPSPIPYAHVTTSTTHKTLRGPRGGLILSSEEFAREHKLNRAVFPGVQGGPQMHVIAAKAVAFKEILDPSFKCYQQLIIDNCRSLARGLMDHGFELFTGGTDNHLMLVDLRNKGLTGKACEALLDSVNITCNKNAIPNDPTPPNTTSGIRLGTAAVAARGMGGADMERVAAGIAAMVEDPEGNREEVLELVAELTGKYPLYRNL